MFLWYVIPFTICVVCGEKKNLRPRGILESSPPYVPVLAIKQSIPPRHHRQTKKKAKKKENLFHGTRNKPKKDEQSRHAKVTYTFTFVPVRM
jgi:hypothetical protein